MGNAEQEVHATIREWIVAIIRQRREIIGLAMSQRAKFEGWLKFELADIARRNGARNLRFEPSLANGRADLSFDLNGAACVVELKTPNTNYRMEGAANLNRPITKNIASIIEDAHKLGRCGGGIVAFILFPLTPGSGAWVTYLARVSEAVGQTLSLDEHVSRETVPLSNGTADLAVVTFDVPSL